MPQGQGLKRRFREALTEDERTAQRTQERLEGFDPFETMLRGTEASAKLFFRGLGENLESLRGQQVALGRLRTGFGAQDEARFRRDRAETFTGQLAQQAVPLAGLQLDAIRSNNPHRDRYLELLSAGLDRQQARENAKFGADDFFLGLGDLASSVVPFL